jgi:hypothetical protein
MVHGRGSWLLLGTGGSRPGSWPSNLIKSRCILQMQNCSFNRQFKKIDIAHDIFYYLAKACLGLEVSYFPDSWNYA